MPTSQTGGLNSAYAHIFMLIKATKHKAEIFMNQIVKGPIQGNNSQHPSNSSTGDNMPKTSIFCQICGLCGHFADRY